MSGWGENDGTASQPGWGAPAPGWSAPAPPPPPPPGYVPSPPGYAPPPGSQPLGGALPPPPPNGAYPPPGYASPYGYQPYTGGMIATAKNNGLCIASLVVSLVSLLCFGIVTGPLAVIFGLVGRRQVRTSGGMQTGEGMGLAGIIIGTLSFVGYVALYALVLSRRSSTGPFIHLGN